MPANIRVLVASEHVPIRRFLKRLVTEEPGAAVAAEASSEAEAITLARELKPDIALLDFHLPHAVGFDSIRLSRISGLDAAEAISGELPDVRVVLLTNLNTAVLQRRSSPRGDGGHLPAQRGSIRMSLTLRELCFESAHPGAPAFVDATFVKQHRRSKQRRLRGMALGVFLSLVGVWMLVGTILFLLFMLVGVTR